MIYCLAIAMKSEELFLVSLLLVATMPIKVNSVVLFAFFDLPLGFKNMIKYIIVVVTKSIYSPFFEATTTNVVASEEANEAIGDL